MSAYLWLSVIGLVMFFIGAFGQLYSTRIEMHKIEREIHIHYYDKEKGWIRTWVDNSGDAEEFWRMHQIVDKEKK